VMREERRWRSILSSRLLEAMRRMTVYWSRAAKPKIMDCARVAQAEIKIYDANVSKSDDRIRQNAYFIFEAIKKTDT
jgi:hypothetical protein